MIYKLHANKKESVLNTDKAILLALGIVLAICIVMPSTVANLINKVLEIVIGGF